MVVSIRDAAKMIMLSIMACCAVFVCTLFLHYHLDLPAVRDEISTELALRFYEAQTASGKVVCGITGGCLTATTAVMLVFYLKHYIDVHKKELGILKALGYGNWEIARHFWVFGLSILLGTAVGFTGAASILPWFYHVQNEDGFLPDVPIRLHPMLALFLILLPALLFALLAVLYAAHKLRAPALSLIRDNWQQTGKAGRHAARDSGLPFLGELRRTTVRGRKSMIFFILFSAFCFSAMTQMAFSMNDLASPMMGVMILVIGLLLAFMTLFLAVTTVVNANTKTIAMMKAFGYAHTECKRALLDGYRPLACVGFAVGTVYQYVLLKLMVEIVFRDIGDMPDFTFDYPGMFVSLAVFAVAYELIMAFYAARIRRIPVKEIMLE